VDWVCKGLVWKCWVWKGWVLKGWVLKGWVWKGRLWKSLVWNSWVLQVGFRLCSLEGGEGGVLGWSGLVAGGRPNGDRHKAGCGGGGPGPLL
jgi:hypothetical protein